MTRVISIATALIFACLAISTAAAQDVTLGTIQIRHPYARAMVPGAKVGGGYLSVTNTGTEDDRLVGVASPRAASAGVHEMSVKDDVMIMREVADGIVIPAGATVELKPGGYHVMFMDVAEPFKQGESIAATLTFDKAGSVDVVFSVGATSGGAPATDDSDHDMGAMEMPADPLQAITARMKSMFETPEKPLTVQPVVVSNDWAIASWLQDGRGGRVLLKKSHHGWSAHLCSGDSLKDAATLETIGVPAADAAALAGQLANAEDALGANTLALFGSFEGTVVLDGGKTEEAGAGGHAGHAQ